MASPSTLFWRLIPDVRPGERSRFLFFFALYGVVSMALTLGLAGSEALFLARVGIAALPAAFVLASLVTVVGSLVVAVLVGRWRNDLFFVRVLLLGAAVLATASVAALLGVAGVLTALFCLFFLLKAVYENHYWTFTSDYFDTITSKRLFSGFLAGGSLGGFAGGALAVVLIRFTSAEVLIAAWAGLLLVAAGMLRLARRPLRRWGPLELEEKDETSAEAVRGAVRYISRGRLAKGFVVSTGAMVLALFVSQYLYSDLLVREFPDAERLAVFLGAYLAITNLIEVAIELRLTPWLIQRLGVPSANLIHPMLTLLVFGGLAADYSLIPAIAARANRELLEQSLGQSIRTLSYNTIPLRFRGRLRLLLEGAVVYLGMALAGSALLLLGGRLEPIWLCALGGGVACVYLGANLFVRREYLRTIVDQLRVGRLDLDEIGEEIGSFEISRLAELWETLLQGDSEYASQSVLSLALVLTERGSVEPVVRAAKHSNPRVRRACVEALAASRNGVEHVLLAALEDEAPAVRLAAVRGAALRGDDAELRAALLDRLRDPDPAVRAEAAAGAGEAGLATLRGMLGSDRTDEVLPALERLPAELLDQALEHAGSDDPALRAVALTSLSRVTRPVPLDPASLTGDLEHPDVRVRRAALEALATHPYPVAMGGLARALHDPARAVRVRAASALGEIGDDGISATEPFLDSDDARAVEGALQAIAAVGTPRSRAVLGAELRRRVHDSWRSLLALRVLPKDGSSATRFLAAAYRDAAERNRQLAFRVLELLEDARVMRTVDKVLRLAHTRARSDALEVLSNLGDRDSSRLLVMMLEEGPIEEKLGALAGEFAIPRDEQDVVTEARQARDPWLRLAVQTAHTEEQERQMERLLVLRQVSLFSGLSLDELEAVSQLMTEERYLQDEIICNEGDLGGELYVLVEGEARFYRNYGSPQALLLNTQGPPTFFGDMAVLADAPRSATIVASKDSTLLKLGGESLKELILQVPDLSFQLFRVLSDRVRRAEERLQHLVDAGQIQPPDDDS